VNDAPRTALSRRGAGPAAERRRPPARATRLRVRREAVFPWHTPPARNLPTPSLRPFYHKSIRLSSRPSDVRFLDGSVVSTSLERRRSSRTLPPRQHARPRRALNDERRERIRLQPGDVLERGTHVPGRVRGEGGGEGGHRNRGEVLGRRRARGGEGAAFAFASEDVEQADLHGGLAHRGRRDGVGRGRTRPRRRGAGPRRRLPRALR
jgi:hypothetical protein